MITMCTREPYTPPATPTLHDVYEVTLGPIAHGGHVVAHVDGRPVFVRHGLPGERVLIEITSSTSKVSRGRVVEVLDASQDRVVPPCRWAGGCGGCDFQHVDLSAQRQLKAKVVRESMHHFARVDVPDLVVAAVPGDETGLGYRTRMGWAHGPRGWGLRGSRSREVIALDSCLIAAKEIAVPPDEAVLGHHADAAVGTDGHVAVSVDGADDRRVVQTVGARQWRLTASSFWQVHRGAASLLQGRVRELAGARPGDAWWDLYSGAGLFAAALGEDVGENGSVIAVEEGAESQREARRALHDLPWVRLVQSPVLPWLESRAADGVHGAVLDPPRSGAGRGVVSQLVRLEVPFLVYVACDPVALARDVATLMSEGYGVDHIEAWDLFPMTHHVEVLAVLSRL